MSVNFVVKPIATYTAVDDTNGGGYVDGYDATYANFCNATGGPTTVYQFSEVSETGGVYSFTFTSGTGSNYIAGQLCYIEHPGYGFWHGRVVATYPADGLKVVYVPVNGGPGYLSEESIATLITNNIDAGEIIVGGALATIEAGAELAKTGLANVMVQTGSYVRTASVTDITDLTIFGVDSDGNLAYGSDRFQEDLATNAIAHAYQYSTATDSRIQYYNASPELYSVNGTATSLILYTASVTYYTHIDDVYVRNTGGRNSTYVLFGNDTSHYETGNVNKLTTDGIYRAYYTRNANVAVPASRNSIIDATEYSYGRYGVGAGFANSCIILCSKLLTNVRGFNRSSFVNCLIIAQNSTDDLLSALHSGYNYNDYFDNCIFVGFDELFAAVPDTEQELMKNCAFYNVGSIGNTINDLHQGNFDLSADPFVDSANGDYRLNPAGPDFAKLYDTTTGRVLIGATGPEMTTGGGGGVSKARLFGGGL